MKLSEKITTEHLHHAYLIEHGKEEGIRIVHELMNEFGIATTGNPDFHEYVLDVLLLEHANNLRREQSFYGAGGAKKIFLVAFNTIGHEAQNALLKTLEEPTEGTHFFFITETREHLLPTFLSRVQVIANQSLVASGQWLGKTAGEEFLAASISERMKMIEPMTKAKTDDKPKAKENARDFLESLERALYRGVSLALEGDSSVKDVGTSRDATSALENVILAKRHLSGRAPSLKLLLEHLALTVLKVSE